MHAAPAIARRRAVAATVQRSAAAAAAPSPARGLQQRLGNQATQALVARSVASRELSAKSAKLPAKVSKPTESAELEAEATARKIIRMRESESASPKAGAAPRDTVQRAAAPSAETTPAGARVNIPGGSPLPASLRRDMEPRFGASFGNVRVHTGDAAAGQSAALNARAFTVGEHVFFARNEYQPQSASGRELIAHELTHTIQQGAAVQRSVDTTVMQRSEPRVQRLGISDALDWIADKANYLPGFRLLTIVLGMNPINFASVDRSAANILRALLELIPLWGVLLAQALDNYGIFAKVGAWVEGQIRSLGLVGSALKGALDKFLDSLSWTDIFDLGDVYERGKRIFTDPIDRLIEFGKSLVTAIIGFIREAILLPLAKLAEGTRGYDLLKVVLGRDPITDEPVPQSPEALIGGFMKFIGEEEIWQNLQKANAVARAWAWFQGALEGLLGFVRQIPTLFVTALNSLELVDLVLPPKAFLKIAGVFGGFALRFVTWAGNAVWTLLEIIFEVVSPATLAYLKKTGAALKGILKNPLPFVRNLVRAAKLGFQNFADNFLTHLKAGLIEWLTGSLPGVYIPQAFTLGEIVKFVFSVLGLTWANIRPKLVKVVGETAVKAMETGFDIVVTLVTEGPAAAWEKIQQHLSNLKDMVIGGITDFVVETVVKKAVPKLIAMFIPGAGFISAIISIYDTIMVFVDKLSRIVAVVKGFVDSIVDIASGAIEGAAKRVESTLAGVLSLAISFLAGFVGLGDVAEKVMGVILKIRATVDKAIDALIAWIVTAAKKLFTAAKAGVRAIIGWWKTKTSFKAGGEAHTLSFAGEGAAAKLVLASAPRPVEQFLDEKADEAKGDKPKQEAIKKVRALIKEVDKLTKGASGEDEKVQMKVEDLMNEMGDCLVVLLSDEDWGTETNPAAFDYPKRRADAYPTFYLATGTLMSLDQKQMQAKFGTPAGAKGGQIYRYRPTQPTDAPDSSAQLGLAAASQVDVGRKVFFEDKEARGGGVSRFKSLVGKFGFVASESGWDIDHVVELQIGGKDEFDNMWPLPKGENRSSGSIIKNANIEITSAKVQKPLKTGLEEKKKGSKGKKPQDGLWLLIKSTRQL